MGDFWEPLAKTLLASAARTTSGEGAEVGGFGHYRRIRLELDVTVAADVADDKLDVLVDVDGIPAVHFTQIAGNGDPVKRVAFLEAGAPATTDADVTADPDAGVVRPYVLGDVLQVRYEITDGGAHGQSFTFGVEAFGQV
jgi:hypothetical protein